MIYCASDFHGNLKAFNNLKKALHPEDICIILGDACDRGTHGVEILRQIKKDDRFVYMVGNHDDFVLRTFLPEKVHSKKHSSSWGRQCWLYNTGPSIQEWENLRKADPRSFKELLEWLSNCMVYAEVFCNNTLYKLAHAKFPKNLEQLSMTWAEMESFDSDLMFTSLWDRYTDYRSYEDFVTEGCISLIGHTPLHSSKSCQVTDGLYNLDNALGYGNNAVLLYCLSTGTTFVVDENTWLPRGKDQLRIVQGLKFECFKNSADEKIYELDEALRQNTFDYISAVGKLTDEKRGFFNARVRTSPLKSIVRVNDDTMLLCSKNTVYKRL